MPLDQDEKALLERFSAKYKFFGSELLRKIERSNCGCDYGATSFATLKQIDDLGTKLGLRPGKRLLEVGAGSGWPGLYLAKITGCDVTLTDLPIEGLLIAKQRATTANLTAASRVAVASGTALPFRQDWFHAISHSDVLCCLVDKLSVLKACRDVVRAEGKMIFTAILISPDLSSGDYATAVESGPSFMACDKSYSSLLIKSGWQLVEHMNLTAEFLDTLLVKLKNELKFAGDLERLLGKDETAIRLERTQQCISAVELGLIRRELFHVKPATITD